MKTYKQLQENIDEGIRHWLAGAALAAGMAGTMHHAGQHSARHIGDTTADDYIAGVKDTADDAKDLASKGFKAAKKGVNAAASAAKDATDPTAKDKLDDIVDDVKSKLNK